MATFGPVAIKPPELGDLTSRGEDAAGCVLAVSLGVVAGGAAGIVAADNLKAPTRRSRAFVGLTVGALMSALVTTTCAKRCPTGARLALCSLTPGGPPRPVPAPGRASPPAAASLTAPLCRSVPLGRAGDRSFKMKSKETKPAEVRTSSAPNSVVRKVNTVLGCRTLRAWPCRLHPRPRRRICSAMISWHRRPRQLWKHRLTLAPSAQRRRATVMAVWGSRMPLIHVRRRAPRSSACSPLRSPYPAWHRSLRAARPGRRPLQGKWPSACLPSPRSRWLQVRCKSRTAIVSVLTRHRSSLPRASFWHAQHRSSHVPSCSSTSGTKR